ncbi:MAG: M48 family metallopeptidase [Spirochaetales bacterium]
MLDLNYEIIRTNRRTLSLSIDKNAKLIVRAPLRMKAETILKFVKEKEGWIAKKQEQVKNSILATKEYSEYSKFMFLGQSYSVVRSDKVGNIELKDALYVPITTKNLQKALKDWLFSLSNAVLEGKINYFSQLLGVRVNSVKFVNSRAKWGSCDAKQNITLNIKMLMLPQNLIDYIIVHELSHIKQLNHSQNFWFEVKKYVPNYLTLRKTLKQNGFLLNLF